MTPDDITRCIDSMRQRQLELARATWIAPPHIAEAVEPERVALELKIHELKVQLFKELGGAVDDRDSQAGA